MGARFPKRIRRRSLLSCLCLFLLFCASCQKTGEIRSAGGSGEIVPFRDLAKTAGLSFQYDTGAAGKFYYIEETGAGCAFVDFNRDGFLDVVLVQSGGPFPRKTGSGTERTHPALFKNKGDGTFANITRGSGLDNDLGYGQGIAVGDYDNDGFDDLYITGYGGNTLLRNENGSGQFRDVTKIAGVGDTETGARYATSSAFGDFDNDGFLDLYVCHYSPWTPENNVVCKTAKGADDYCTPDALDTDVHRLYRNTGKGTFVDVTQKSGIGKKKGHGLGVVWLDYDDDGDSDIFVSNDLNPQFLWRNNGNSTFTEVAEETGTAFDRDAGHLAGMGIGVGDYNNSGRESLFVTNFHDQPNTLFRNMGGGLFEDASMEANVALPHMKFVAFGCDFLDYDADGWKDLIVANGHVVMSVAETTEGVTYKERKQLFRNNGTGRFVEVLAGQGDLEIPTVSRGLATGDYDNDGRVDFLVMNQHDPAQLFHNENKSANRWISFKTVGTKSNRNGYGAKITVRAGTKRYFGEVRGSSSYLSSGDSRAYFGLGEGVENVDSVTVKWPSGTVDKIAALPANASYILTEGKGKTGVLPTAPRP